MQTASATKPVAHVSSGNCPKCREILNRYPGLEINLRGWFITMQAKFTELHVSCAGRGRNDQEALYLKGATRAHYGQSAHNYNAAIDVFFLIGGQYNLDEARFDLIALDIPLLFEWYGQKGAKFYERPHIEVKGWLDAHHRGELRLVE